MFGSLSDINYLMTNIVIKTLTAGKTLTVYFPFLAPRIFCQFTYTFILLKCQ